MKAAPLLLACFGLSLLLAGCGPSTAQRAAERQRILARARAIPVADSAPWPKPITPADFVAVGASGRIDAVEIIERNLPADAPAELIAAAALGLGANPTPAVERVLLGLAARPPHVPETVDALVHHYRIRQTVPPDPALAPPKTFPVELAIYADHPDPRGRAAYARLVTQIRELPPAAVTDRLLHDPDFEVRRAAATIFSELRAPAKRPAAERDRCIAALAALLNGSDNLSVLSTAIRVLASYDDPRVAELLAPRLKQANFHVRNSAAAALGTRKIAAAAPELAELAKADSSPSVRTTALSSLAALNPSLAQAVAVELLASPDAAVRAAACEVLARTEDGPVAHRLAELAASDPNMSVRQAALTSVGASKDEALVRAAVEHALVDRDPNLAGIGCTLAAKHGFKDLIPQIVSLLERGADTEDASASALRALAKLDLPGQRSRLQAFLNDRDPNVRDAAAAALAEPGQPAPKPSRGAGVVPDKLLPGEMPVFGRDPRLIVETDQGTMTILLYPEQAPVHCAHVVALARRGFYDGLTWHRVVSDFVIQGGCPRGDGSGSAGTTLPLEPTTIPFERGTLGMPRSANPDSGGCQLFICHSRALHLDAAHTAFGRVIEGLSVVDKIDVGMKILRVTVSGVK